MKKFISLLMAIVMVFTLATPVKAEQNFTITHPGNDHTYEIYQIFTGDYSTEKKVLSNIKWGANGTGATGEKVSEDILNELNALTTKPEQEKLAAIEKYVKLGTTPVETLTKTEGTATVTAGYYLIKDVDKSVTGHDAYTEYIVKVVNDVVIAPKSVKPTVDKQVWDEASDDDKEADENWGETADHEISEVFEFKLIATLPADVDYEGYQTYRVVFQDTMSAGVTYVGNVDVKLNGTDKNGNTKEVDVNVEPAFTDATQKSFSLTIADVKSAEYGFDLTKGLTITVTYDAKLNENAVVGNEDDNLNTVYLQYSNNPNLSGTGDNYTDDDKENGKEPGNNDNELGETPKDTVWVFTYKVDVTKVDGQNTATKLDDAEFQLKNAAGKWVVVDGNGKVTGWEDKQEDGSTLTTVDGKFTVIGLDHGTYYLVETKAPDGYNLLDAEVPVVITAVHQELTATTAESLNGTATPNVDMEVKNNKGITLPETGGMGTTLFYVFGSLLAVGAIVLLVTKKRMNEE